ncbi:MAG: hypothetical protein DRP45_05115 [Candidatus Zixiibacteriota bacterium]|nr:MAG: hypothetical protein DRP45_05115 [candidate division Zixibacteria bacterium]
MNRLSILLAVVLLLAFSVNVVAQDDEEYEEKDFLEIALFGGGTFPMGGITDWTTKGPGEVVVLAGAKAGPNFGFDIGHFLTTNLVLGLNFTYSHLGIDSDNELITQRHHRFYNTSLYLKYYFFGESDFVPYVRANAGVDIMKFTTEVFDTNHESPWEYREQSYDPAFGVGVGAGLFRYIHDYGGLYVEANFHNSFTSGSNATYEGLDYDFKENATSIGIQAGVKVFFGSD